MSEEDRRKKIGTRTRRATQVQVAAQRAEALRLRAEGLSVTAIGGRLGVSPQRAGKLLKPVPDNFCRACGVRIEPRKRYHPQCRPSTYLLTGRPSGSRPKPLPERQYGLWTVLSYDGASKWRCRCRCGVERPVTACSLKDGSSRGCQSCSAKGRWAKVRGSEAGG